MAERAMPYVVQQCRNHRNVRPLSIHGWEFSLKYVNQLPSHFKNTD